MIMEKFGWTLEYVNWKIPFAVLNRITADLPWFDYDKDPKNAGKPKKKGVKLTSDSFLDMVQRINESGR